MPQTRLTHLMPSYPRQSSFAAAHHPDPVYPDYLYNGRAEQWRETVGLTWGIFPFDVSVIFEQFASAQVTIEDELERLMTVQEDSNVPKSPMTDAQFRLIRLAAHLADLLDHLNVYMTFPIETAWYDRTFLQEHDNGKYSESNARATAAEKAWMAQEPPRKVLVPEVAHTQHLHQPSTVRLFIIPEAI